MKKLKLLLSFTVVLSMLFVGCKKYDDGPAISLKTKKARLSRTWVVEKYVDKAGATTTPSSNDESITFDKAGVVTISAGSFSLTGTWEFNSDKSGIITRFTFMGTSSIDEAKILRLTSSEFWVEDKDGDKTYYKAK